MTNPKGAGRKPPALPTERVTFRLNLREREALKKAGNGVAVRGLRALIAQIAP